MAEKNLTIKEVAAYLKVAEKSIYRLLAQEKFPGFKVGGTWRFRKSEIEHWINTQSIKMRLFRNPRGFVQLISNYLFAMEVNFV